MGDPVLSSTHEATVRATLPAVGAHLETITALFYDTMLAENPELRRLFSRSAQASGEQRRALAGAVIAFASDLVGEGASFDPVIRRIAHRHASLGIRPEQYTLVGRYLLNAVGAVLGEAVTPAVAAAWDEVYWLFACRLIGLEARLYAHADIDPDHPWREVVVSHRREEAQDTVSFVLTSADGAPMPSYRAGQYVSVAVDLPDGGRQIRQYSLSQAAHGLGGLRITVRRVRGVGGAPDGLVSSHLVDHVRTGDRLEVSAPYGDLTLTAGTAPLVLVSAGVGITPMAAILDHVSRTEPNRDVVVAHAERSLARHCLRPDIIGSGARLRSFRHLVWYERQAPYEADGSTEVRAGRIEVDEIPLAPEAQVYLCGPLPFMQAVRSRLRDRGVPGAQIRYEVFGSDAWAGSRS
ncbi:hemin transporter [Micromonospora musae]|uniref:nitric oxide dioxygenase n=1 Tax=Micromonospora musae TaxID=1894970 RepID=A0ABX9QV95_9ACTN|nr:hemin transporter [Micromonospora musae]